MFVSQYAVPVTHCPHCGTVLEAATGLSSVRPEPPTPGTLTLCNECERWLVFTDSLGLRIATDEDVAQTDPLLRRLILASRTFHRKVH